jgi:hypothetical protein
MQSKFAFVLVALVLAATASAAGHDDRMVLGDVQLGWLQTLRPPVVTCVGGEPTGNPYDRCTAGTTRILGKDELQLWSASSETIKGQANGSITFVVNCSLSPSYRGPCWGTFKWEVPHYGVWEGYWTSPVMDLMTFESRMSLVGVGTSGKIEGKHLTFDGGSAAGEWYITGTVVIR